MPAKILIPEEIIQKLCQLYRELTSVSELVKLFNFSAKTIRNTLQVHLKEEYKELARQICSQSGKKAAKKLRGRKNPHTPEWNAKISAAQKGKKLSDETKQKISQKNKEQWENGIRTKELHAIAMKKAVETKKENNYYKIHSERHSQWMKENSPLRGKPVSDETKAKMREAKARYFANGGKPSQLGRKKTEKEKREISKRTKEMWKNKKFQYGNGLFRSKLEKSVFELVKTFDSNSQHSFQISTDEKNYIFDIFIPSINTILEINGDYWHLNPSLYSSDFFDESRKIFAREIWDKDNQRKLIAETNGYKFITLWESELKNVDHLNEAINVLFHKQL